MTSLPELAALPPEPRLLTIAGERLDLSPIRVGELPRFLAALRPFLARLAEEPDWLQLLADDGPALIQALSIAVRREPAWLEALPLDAAVHLSGVVFEVNADFFVHRLLPEIRRTGAHFDRLTPWTGMQPSSGSSGPATATPTS